MKTLSTGRLRHTWAECREHLRHLRLRGCIGAYADGELGDAQRDRVAAHLARCWACGGCLQTLRLIKHSLRGRPQRAPVSLAATRMRRFAGRLATTPSTHQGPDP
ncbi:MAG: zf-HC2 domain-containing protein [Streptomyces sp.]|jgi:anti-sigma factor RsiW|nr:zf-HC2 domain-containing protein [Streptomyces sp.]